MIDYVKDVILFSIPLFCPLFLLFGVESLLFWSKDMIENCNQMLVFFRECMKLVIFVEVACVSSFSPYNNLLQNLGRYVKFAMMYMLSNTFY